MNQDDLLDTLIFCNICYLPYKSTDNKSTEKTLLISYCMHIICYKCIKETDYCVICNSHTTYIPLNKAIINKIKRNPTELFAKPVDITMFQINSAINIIEKMKNEISNYKKLLQLAKCEINNLKNTRTIQKSTHKKVRSTQKKARSTHKKGKSKICDKVSNVCKIIKNNRKTTSTVDISSTGRKDKSILDFSSITNKSINSGRITIPKGFNPYKKFYRK